MTPAKAWLRLGFTIVGTIIGVWIGSWSWSRHLYRQQRREAKRLIAAALAGTEVETKRSWRTIRRK